MATALLKTAAKVGLGVGAVYVTVQQGVWNNSNLGTKALTRVRNSVLPTASEYVNSVPSLDEVNTSILDSWNGGVRTVFGFLADSPKKIGRYSRQAIDSTANFISDVTKS